MVHKVLFWSAFGIAVRAWQRGIEMQPILAKNKLWVYPVYATVGGSFGYWLSTLEQQQMRILSERRNSLLEKRRRRDEREANIGTPAQLEEESSIATI